MRPPLTFGRIQPRSSSGSTTSSWAGWAIEASDQKVTVAAFVVE
jgi:hypothetical protein